MADSYDLIFLGVSVQDADRQAAVVRIADLLGVHAEEVYYLVDNQVSAAVKQGLALEEARRLQGEMASAGAVCNYRPSQWAGQKLELAPVERRREEYEFTCPACEHKQTVASEEELPTACPACGIIPSKYDKVSIYKQVRGMPGKPVPPTQPSVRVEREPLPPKSVAEPPPFPQPATQYPLYTAWQEPVAAPKHGPSGVLQLGAALLVWALGVVMGGLAVGIYYDLWDLENWRASHVQAATPPPAAPAQPEEEPPAPPPDSEPAPAEPPADAKP